jgi:hypothetical protein
MNKFAVLTAAAVTALSFGLGAALAQGTDDFDKADANKDKWVSMEEAMAVYPTLTEDLFKQADANADGNLDSGEFTALQGLTAGLDSNVSSSSSAM